MSGLVLFDVTIRRDAGTVRVRFADDDRTYAADYRIIGSRQDPAQCDDTREVLELERVRIETLDAQETDVPDAIVDFWLTHAELAGPDQGIPELRLGDRVLDLSFDIPCMGPGEFDTAASTPERGAPDPSADDGANTAPDPSTDFDSGVDPRDDDAGVDPNA